jgi:hypothetical protein
MFQEYINGFAVQYVRDKEELPEIKFLENSMFYQVCQFLANNIHLNISSQATEDEIIYEAMSQLETILQNPEYNEYVLELQKASNFLSRDVSKAFDILRRDIAEEVTALYEDIRLKTDDYLKKAGADVLTLDNKPSTDFGVIKWDNLRNLSYVQNIFDVVKITTNLVPTPVTAMNINSIRNKIMQPGFQPIEISDEIKTNIVDAIDKMLTNRSSEEVKEAIDIFFLPIRYSTYCNTLSKYMDRGNNIDENLIEISNRIALVNDIIRAIGNLQIDLSEETLGKLSNNVSKVKTTTTLGEYFTLYCKEVVYKNKLIINENMINGDELAKFSRTNGQLEDIAYYLRSFFSDKKVPVGGVTTDSVIESKAKVKEMIESQNIIIKSKAKMLMGKSLGSAYLHVMNDYLKNVDESRLPQGVSKDDYYKRNYSLVTRTMDSLHGKDNNVEDALYKFLLELNYSGTIIQSLYNYMGKEYPKLLQQYDSINEDSILNIVDNYVVSTLITEYLLKSHCK